MVENLEIAGIKYPVIVNFYVIGEFQRETGYSFDVLEKLPHMLYLVEPLLWYSLKLGHLVAKQDFTLKREDMPLFLSDDKTYESFFEVITKFFPESKDNTKNAKKK